jgi:hypothetical protein
MGLGRRIGVVGLMVLTACLPTPAGDGSSTPSASGSPDAGPSGSAAALCAIPPPDFEAYYLSLQEFDALECYGDVELMFDAFWGGGPGGAIDCPQVDPAWFSCSAFIEISPLQDEAAMILAATTGDLMFGHVAVHPDAELGMDQFAQGNARLTGHFDDPAAQGCHYLNPGPDLTDDEAVYGCRHTFVVTVMEPH